MNKFGLMTDAEICAEYSQAKDKSRQIGILADENLTTREQIIDILVDGGVMSKTSSGQYNRQIKSRKAQEPEETKMTIEPEQEKKEVAVPEGEPKPEAKTVPETVPAAITEIVRRWLNSEDVRQKYEEARDVVVEYERVDAWLQEHAGGAEK